MFGYATTLRSATQGKANYTMEFSRYLPVPEAMEEELVAEAAEKAKAKRGV
jgi:elongation factor G